MEETENPKSQPACLESSPLYLFFFESSLPCEVLANVERDKGAGILSKNCVRSYSVLTVVEEDDHAVRVHGLASEELEVLEVGNDLLGETGSAGLESLDLVVRGTVGLHGLLDLLHVLLEVAEVGLLVERGLVEAERVDNVDDGGGLVVGTLVTTVLSGGVGTDV